VLLATSLLGAPSDKYSGVTINANGSVTVNTEDGRQITPARLAPIVAGMEHVGAEQAAVSPDRQSVVWLAVFDNAGRPIPLKLVILTNGRLSSLRGSDHYPIWFWNFQDNGRRVAFQENAPYGLVGLHYELWDVKRVKRVADYRPEYEENGHPIAWPNEPEWVKTLDAAEKKSR